MTKSKRAAPFIQYRRELRQALQKYPGVRAWGWGVKFTGNAATGEECLTVFVAKKLGQRELRKTEIIPTTLRHAGRARRTDVVEWGRFRRQAAPQNYPFGDCLTDHVRNGTRSAYVLTEQGLMALTCSHVVAGDDGNPATPAAVESFDWSNKSWRPFGQSHRALYEAGAGAPLDFGYLDAALVAILPDVAPSLQVQQKTRAFLQPSNEEDIRRLVGMPVRSFGIASGACQGVIQAVLVSGVDDGRFAADLVVSAVSPSGVSREGDSGMLWEDDSGVLIGQHALGEAAPPGEGSRLTIATLIHRVRDKLGIASFR